MKRSTIKKLKELKSVTHFTNINLNFENVSSCDLDPSEVTVTFNEDLIRLYIPNIEKYSVSFGENMVETYLYTRLVGRKDIVRIYFNDIFLYVAQNMGDDNVNPDIFWDDNTNILTIKLN